MAVTKSGLSVCVCTHLDVSECVLGALGDHVHAHGVARRRTELDEEVSPRGHCLYPPQPGEPAGAVEVRLDEGEVVLVLQPLLAAVHLADVGEPHHWTPAKQVSIITSTTFELQSEAVFHKICRL